MQATTPTATFCTSLRRQSEWAPVTDILLRSEELKWREHKLDTHDIALPFTRGLTGQGGGVFRFLLLSQANITQEQATQQKIERLYHLNTDVGIVFLLSGGEQGADKFIEFQIHLTSLNLDLPALPLSSHSALPQLLTAFQRRLGNEAGGGGIPPVPRHFAGREVLPYCTTAPAGLLTKHGRNVLTDLCRGGLRDLVDAVSSAERWEVVRSYIGEEEARGVWEFWAQEFETT